MRSRNIQPPYLRKKGMPIDEEKVLQIDSDSSARRQQRRRPGIFNVGIESELIIMVNYDLFSLIELH
jgi:hypothetical protein